ncbi:MAG TPA: NHLP leader peptide family RiPP precursor [Blastocatellia bacterium]|nr:NHLP leader peptide family RiPP precursor [Blastocatellia bacterium]
MAKAQIAFTSESQSAWRGVVAKAWADEKFKSRLMDNPNKALAEAGLSIPRGVNFVVVENEPQRVYLVLPTRPEDELAVLEMKHLESDYDPGF